MSTSFPLVLLAICCAGCTHVRRLDLPPTSAQAERLRGSLAKRPASLRMADGTVVPETPTTISDSTLVLAQESAVLRVPLRRVDEIVVRSPGRGLADGFLVVGGVVGGLITLVGLASPQGGCSNCEAIAPGGAVLIGGIAGLLGGIVGAIIGSAVEARYVFRVGRPARPER